jgi:phosphoglucan,water dikinase
LFGGPDDILMEIEKSNKTYTGAKTSNMRDLTRLKIASGNDALYDTPLSFCIPYSVYLVYASSILNIQLYKTVDECKIEELETNSAALREHFIEKCMNNSEIPELNTIAEKIKEIYSANGTKKLAIRSSSNLEDLKKSAGAGLFDSYIGIDSENIFEIKNAICKVWASLFTYRALLARRKSLISSNNAIMAVLIQEMINPEYCFVIHTVNPVNKDNNEVYIEMAIGLGETLASANQRGSPYRMIFNKIEKSSTITNYASFQYALKNGENLERISYKNVSFSNSDEIFKNVIMQLGLVSMQLEKEFDGPQDVEGGIYKSKIFLVQTRPQLV